MTTREAKQDLLARLLWHGVTFEKMTARTISFIDLARGSRVFVTVRGADWPGGVTEDTVRVGMPIPRPYSIEFRR